MYVTLFDAVLNGIVLLILFSGDSLIELVFLY